MDKRPPDLLDPAQLRAVLGSQWALVYKPHPTTPADRLAGYDAVADARFAAPLSAEWLSALAAKYPRILTIEDHIHMGGFGMRVRDDLIEKGLEARVRILALPDRFIEQGTREELLKRYHISAEGIEETVEKWYAEA